MAAMVGYQLARAASGGHKLFAAPIAIEPHAEQIVRGLEKIYASKGVICEFEIEPQVQFHGGTPVRLAPTGACAADCGDQMRKEQRLLPHAADIVAWASPERVTLS